ncbi:hypothetical protein AWB67_02270 [Caballeronia terrestris]|uniref:Astacin (Peptidase family M12A) n=1 Tax=Caballeronia terrestris TaxID=1226301 RepID=A0A158I0B6_9BURK|nr:hypothetical protein [Caballeronia terrestris]SAL49763.1 hypothetical protein AWB67_02270 [Caballeronia terrestris]
MRKFFAFFVWGLGQTFSSVAPAHSTLSVGKLVNPPIESGDRGTTKLDFLASQARRNGVDAATVAAASSIFYRQYVWHKSDLQLCFWNGTDEQQREVISVADVWHAAAPNMTFNYIENGKVRMCELSDLKNTDHLSDIRISLSGDDPRPIYSQDVISMRNGDWAYPGNVYSQNRAFPTTVNLAAAMELRKAGRLRDYYFDVRHEFGHALGLFHEHQSQICKGWFNIKAIAKDTNWTEAYAETQINALGSAPNVLGIVGGYDNQSIMQYNFEPSWYMPDRQGQPNPCRRPNSVDNLSNLDKAVIDALYDPTLNETPERKALIAGFKQKAAVQLAAAEQGTPSSNPRSSQASSVEAALTAVASNPSHLSDVSIQVYPHKKDKDIVLKAISNLGYPLTDAAGKPILSVSANTTALLRGDPTNAILYTSDVSDQDARYVAVSLIKAGIELKSIEPYYPSKRNKFAVRHNLLQIGADVENRKRKPLSIDAVLSKPLPIYGDEIQ